MTKGVSNAFLGIAMIALGGCSSMPDWMPGSGAVRVDLSGTQEVPAASSSATGSVSFRGADDGTVTGSITTQGVQGTMAHIHQAARGQNGPVIVPLAKSGDTYTVPEGRKLNAAQMQAYKAGNLYVNVHSDRYKGGEIRAQLQP